MKINTNHYMIIYFRAGTNKFSTKTKPVLSRNPKQIINRLGEDTEKAKLKLEKSYKYLRQEEGVVAISFYDVSFLTLKGVNYKSEKHNCSSKIFFGKREKKEYSPHDFCAAEADSFRMNDDDITYDEYVEKAKQKTEQKVKTKKQK